MEALLYSKVQAAQVLNLSVRTLEGLLRRGQLSHRKVGRRVLIHHEELRRFAEGKVKAQKGRRTEQAKQ